MFRPNIEIEFGIEKCAQFKMKKAKEKQLKQ